MSTGPSLELENTAINVIYKIIFHCLQGPNWNWETLWFFIQILDENASCREFKDHDVMAIPFPQHFRMQCSFARILKSNHHK